MGRLNFSMAEIPSGLYYVGVEAKEHDRKREVVFVEEGTTLKLSLEAKPNKPYLHMYASQKVFTGDEIPQIELHGFTPKEKNIDIQLYRVNLDEVAKKGGLSEALSPLTSPRENDILKLEQASERVQQQIHPIEKVDAEGAYIEPIKLTRQDQGIYFIICRAGTAKAVTTINVSDIALVTKSRKGKSLCYATAMRDGTPIEGVEISTAQGGVLKVAGKTDHEGLVDLDVPSTNGINSLIVGRKNSSVAVVGFREGSQRADDVRMTGYCDRPAYRPGDEINFKGIVFFDRLFLNILNW